MKKYLVGWGLTSVSILSIVGIGSGCGNRPMVRSELHRSQTAVAGVIYSLPRQLVVFRFTREPADLAKLGAEYATKRQAALEAKAAFEARAEEVSKAEEDLKQATGDAIKKAEEALTAAKTRRDQADVLSKKAAVEAEAALSNLQQIREGQMVDKFEMDVLPPSPDPSASFSARLTHGRTRHDSLTIKTSAAGLLETSEAEADDKTASIVTETLSFFTEAAKLSLMRALSGGVRDTSATPTQLQVEPIKYQRIFDPMETDARGLDGFAIIAEDLAKRRAYFAFQFTPGTKAANLVPLPPSEGDGIFYRRPVQHLLTIYDASGVDSIWQSMLADPKNPLGTYESLVAEAARKGTYVMSLQMLLPNSGPIGMVELPTSTAVKTEHNFSFKDGMLLSHESVRPSEALGIASILPNALRAIVAIPAELIQFKIDYSTKDKESVETQKHYIDAQKAYIDAQAALIDSERSLESKQQEESPGTEAGN